MDQRMGNPKFARVVNNMAGIASDFYRGDENWDQKATDFNEQYNKMGAQPHRFRITVAMKEMSLNLGKFDTFAYAYQQENTKTQLCAADIAEQCNLQNDVAKRLLSEMRQHTTKQRQTEADAKTDITPVTLDAWSRASRRGQHH